jgi:hypothetical protein
VLLLTLAALPPAISDLFLRTGSLLTQKIATDELADAFMAFNTNYHDTGLFGVYAVTDRERSQDLSWVLMNEITKMCYEVKEADVARARNQLKASLLFLQDSSQRERESLLLVFGGWYLVWKVGDCVRPAVPARLQPTRVLDGWWLMVGMWCGEAGLFVSPVHVMPLHRAIAAASKCVYTLYCFTVHWRTVADCVVLLRLLLLLQMLPSPLAVSCWCTAAASPRLRCLHASMQWMQTLCAQLLTASSMTRIWPLLLSATRSSCQTTTGSGGGPTGSGTKRPGLQETGDRRLCELEQQQVVQPVDDGQQMYLQPQQAEQHLVLVGCTAGALGRRSLVR